MERFIVAWSHPPAHLRQTQTHRHTHTYLNYLRCIHSSRLLNNNVFRHNMHPVHGVKICVVSHRQDICKIWLLKFRFGSAVYWKQNEICLALRHLPGLSPWAWGRPSATQWPPWRCLPAAAWLREGGGRCGSHCLTPLSLLLEVAHPNLEDKSEKEERIGEGGMEGKWQKMGHVRNS